MLGKSLVRLSGLIFESQILGFNQCLRYESFVIVVKNDTLVTFEDLDSLYGVFPEYYYEFSNWEFMFPEEERSKYPVYVNYNLVEEKDLKAIACNTYCDYREYFNHLRNRQIKINYITKLPLTKVRLEK